MDVFNEGDEISNLTIVLKKIHCAQSNHKSIMLKYVMLTLYYVVMNGTGLAVSSLYDVWNGIAVFVDEHRVPSFLFLFFF
jgi:hypothetical protein